MPYLGKEKVVGDYRQVKIYRCPAYPEKTQTVCFIINGWDIAGPSDTTGAEVTKLVKLTPYRRLGQRAYLADNEYYKNGAMERPIILSSSSPRIDQCDVWSTAHLPDGATEDNGNYSRRVARSRHRQGCNVLFGDWHVSYVEATAMAGKKTPGVGMVRYPGFEMWAWRKF